MPFKPDKSQRKHPAKLTILKALLLAEKGRKEGRKKTQLTINILHILTI